nr:hypothetical protein [Bacteroidales bacterium]
AYTPLKSMSYWGEIHTNGKNWEIGVFGGIYTNTGTKETMSDASNAVYGLATNIASMYRVSPRVIYKINKFSVGAEVEYTSALYGEKYNTNYVPANTNEINNIRLLLSTIYSF